MCYAKILHSWEEKTHKHFILTNKCMIKTKTRSGENMLEKRHKCIKKI
jgi:hypothetical protein